MFKGLKDDIKSMTKTDKWCMITMMVAITLFLGALFAEISYGFDADIYSGYLLLY
jgi:hypothetical protein